MIAILHVILDRDGVLNVEQSEGGYVKDWSQWRWLAGALEGLRLLRTAGIRISVATNQAGVGRGLVDQADLDAIHAQMIAEEARAGGSIDRVFVCPHAPLSGCDCRKPRPGLLIRAIEASAIPRQATMVLSDALRDLEAARAADVSPALVRTGKGRLTEAAIADRGVPVFDHQNMRAGDSHIFIAGDANADLPLLHEAADEGRLAGENAARWPVVYKRSRRTPLGIVFCDPQVAVAGKRHAQLVADGADFAIGEVSFEDQGRARVMLVNSGLLRVYGEQGSGLLLGAEMIGPQNEHLAHLLAWAIQARMTVAEVLQMPFYHPVIEEGLRTALRSLLEALGMGPHPPLHCIDCGPGA